MSEPVIGFLIPDAVGAGGGRFHGEVGLADVPLAAGTYTIVEFIGRIETLLFPA